MLVFTLILDSRNYCVHQFFLYSSQCTIHSYSLGNSYFQLFLSGGVFSLPVRPFVTWCKELWQPLYMELYTVGAHIELALFFLFSFFFFFLSSCKDVQQMNEFMRVHSASKQGI